MLHYSVLHLRIAFKTPNPHNVYCVSFTSNGETPSWEPVSSQPYVISLSPARIFCFLTSCVSGWSREARIEYQPSVSSRIAWNTNYGHQTSILLWFIQWMLYKSPIGVPRYEWYCMKLQFKYLRLLYFLIVSIAWWNGNWVMRRNTGTSSTQCYPHTWFNVAYPIFQWIPPPLSGGRNPPSSGSYGINWRIWMGHVTPTASSWHPSLGWTL